MGEAAFCFIGFSYADESNHSQTIPSTPTPPPASIFSNAVFTYNGDGQRVKSVMTTNLGTTTTYFVGAHYEVANGIVTKYYYAGAQRIAMRSSGTLYFLLGDHLGSTSLVTLANGVVASETRYKPWGEVRYSSAYTPTNYTFTGQYSYASDFGLMFYNARWYDPALGRFAQADTIVPAIQGVQAWDRFAYTNNNPLRYIDPTGHMVACEDGDVCDHDGSGNSGGNSGGGGDNEGNDDAGNTREPGEPRCKAKYCDDIAEILSGTVMGLDVVAGGVSLLEGLAAADAYILAGGACIASGFVGCAPAFGLAVQADMAATVMFGTVENGLGMLSLGFTALSDLLLGNTGIDPDIGPYIGKDTVVSGRNALAGFIPESFIDLGVSLSQIKYDLDRAMNNKSGGYVPVADVTSNWKMPPIHKDFLKQTFLKDWW